MRRPLPELGPPERKLLVNCARLNLGEPEARSTDALLDEPLEWEALLAHAELHSVGPLLYHQLRRLERLDKLPPLARRKLLQLFNRAGYQNRHYAEALQELLEAFSGAGTPLMVLKGLSLVELVYGNPSLRPLIDINCLIPPKESSAAKDLLHQMGYVEVIRPAFRGVYRWLNSQFLMVRPRGFQVHLILQWDVVNWPRLHSIDLGRLWADARPARLAGREALVPSPTDLITYLGWQPDKHGFLNLPALVSGSGEEFIFEAWTHNRLIRFTDIYEVVNRYRGVLDWKLLVEWARAAGVADSLYVSMSWTEKLYGPLIEPWVLEALGRPSPRRLRRWLHDVLAQKPASSSAKAGSRTWRALWSKLGVRNQLRLIWTLNILEFTFPRREEFEASHLRGSGGTALARYLLHVCGSLVVCFVGFLLWAYCLIVPRRQAVKEAPEHPGHEARP